MNIFKDLRGMNSREASRPNSFTLHIFTGILPIKKVQTQSALNNFDEFTMMNARVFAKYVGFVEGEVKQLCAKYGRNFRRSESVWYASGYLLEEYQVYNPKAVVEVLLWNRFQSYCVGDRNSVRRLCR